MTDHCVDLGFETDLDFFCKINIIFYGLVEKRKITACDSGYMICNWLLLGYPPKQAHILTIPTRIWSRRPSF